MPKTRNNWGQTSGLHYIMTIYPQRNEAFSHDLSCESKKRFTLQILLYSLVQMHSIETEDRLGSSWFSMSRDKFEYTVSLGHT